MINHARSIARARLIGRRVRRHFPRPAANLPVIYVPGIVGVTLHDRTHGVDVWGSPGGILRRNPKHADFRLRPGADHPVAALEVLHRFPIVPGLIETLVTSDVERVLGSALGYRRGRDLFFLGYDWRLGQAHLQSRITAMIDHIRGLYGATQRVVIIGQSVANLAIRMLVRRGSAKYRQAIARWYAFGPPWRGTWNAAQMLRDGYHPAGKRFFGFTPEDVLSYPATFELLPADARLLDQQGTPITDFDLSDPDCWVTYGLGPPGLLEVDRAARRWVRDQMQAAARLHAQVGGTEPVDAQVGQVWFAGIANRAVVAAARVDGRTEVTVTKADAVPGATARGDDHVPLSHLTDAACGPLVRDAAHAPLGESYVVLSEAHDHRTLINHGPNLGVLAADMAAVRALEARHVCH